MKIEIFKTSPIIRDGGSIQEIITNLGIFSLIKKLGDPIDYFYDEKGLLDNETSTFLRVSLKEYFSKTAKEDVERAVKVFNSLYNSFGYKAIKIEE